MLTKMVASLCVLAGLSLVGGCAAPPAEEESQASSEEAYTASAMPDEVNRRVERCFTRDWSSRRMTVATDARYVADAAVAASVTKIAGTVLNTVGHVLLLGTTGEAVLSRLEADLKQATVEQGLADHQVVALVMCVSSNLITYADNGIAKTLGASAAVENYEGVCTEFAGIAKRLLRNLGLSAGFQPGFLVHADGSRGGHMWNWVTLGRETYWIEPQRDPLRVPGSALFFNRQGTPGR